MTAVVFPVAVSGARLAYSVALVHADGTPATGWIGAEPVAAQLQIVVDGAPVSCALAAQSAIATADGVPTYYSVGIVSAAPDEMDEYLLIQVPESAEPITLRDLVSASAVPPGDLLAGRLLPAAAADGQSLVWSADADAWLATSAAPGSGIGDAPLTGGPYGRQAGEWAAVATAEQGGRADTAMQPLIYDPNGVHANAFDVSNLTGVIDAGVF